MGPLKRSLMLAEKRRRRSSKLLNSMLRMPACANSACIEAQSSRHGPTLSWSFAWSPREQRDDFSIVQEQVELLKLKPPGGHGAVAEVATKETLDMAPELVFEVPLLLQEY